MPCLSALSEMRGPWGALMSALRPKGALHSRRRDPANAVRLRLEKSGTAKTAHFNKHSAEVHDTCADIAEANDGDNLEAARALQQAVTALIDSPSAESMQAARDAWLEALNVIANPTFPLSGEEVDAIEITPDVLENTLHEADGIEANVATGYHAIEFLLSGRT